MAKIKTTDELRRVYKKPGGRSLTKELTRLDRHARRFIELSPFFVIASSGTGGQTDASPRGEAPGFVHTLDDETIAIPDRPGNNRLDTMQNILLNPEVGLIFFLPGVNETLRINGTAEIRDDDDLLNRFEMKGKRPSTVLLVHVRELYLHCAKALMRSRLWEEDTRHTKRPIPTMSEMINDQTDTDAPIEPEDKMVERYRKDLY